MSGPDADNVVIGSGTLARLVAGLLAAEHGRSVVFVGESQSGYRLPRSIDLSVAAITRPESWALLREAVPETLKLIGRIAGRSAWQHIDPIFFAERPTAVEALSHMRHMAAGHGVIAEPAPPSLVGAARHGAILRDAVRLNRPTLEPALDRWMSQNGVCLLAPRSISVAMDGSAVLSLNEGDVAARHAILADSEAIITHLPLRQWPTLLQRVQTSTILTTPARPLAAPVMAEVDTGTVLLQQAEGGIAGIGSGDLAGFSAHLQALLGRERQVVQAGQTSYPLLATRDGAPAVGRVSGTGADVIAGIDPFGAFLAPALARWLAGAPSPSEAAWFGTRLVNRDKTGPSVADYHPPRMGGAK